MWSSALLLCGWFCFPPRIGIGLRLAPRWLLHSSHRSQTQIWKKQMTVSWVNFPSSLLSDLIGRHHPPPNQSPAKEGDCLGGLGPIRICLLKLGKNPEEGCRMTEWLTAEVWTSGIFLTGEPLWVVRRWFNFILFFLRSNCLNFLY